ncbi:hypothetical protein NDN01_23890 [Sphingomonas sp. QA11]|uniref:hypothetical protein n=1 Tax=Sphingomonas sp. QA11 TaxID=2950605 RepID=UPI002349ED83|nr:hypothetical protein [Sphingomonas sp. QA11]WCM26989.1 hypothetical protein NDN01_23890 [Sphingomonas sp. QA11]
MPTVPREQNRVGIADVTNAKLQPGDYSGTGLQALGAGMQQLGGTGARIAGDLQERQARNDEFEVKKAWNAYAEGARGIRTDALGKAEADPQDMLESMTRDYGGLRDWIRSGLKNDRQRGQFDQVIAERFDYDISGAVAGAEQALRRGQDQQSVLLERNAADDAADNADDPMLFDKHLHTGIDSIVARGMRRGDDPAAIGRNTMAYGSGIRRRVVQGLTDRDPIAAANRYRLMRDGMTQADRQATEAELFEPLARALATGDVDGLLPKQAPDEAASPLTPGQREDAARKIEAEDWTEARKRYARADLAERGLREERRRRQTADAAKEAAFATAQQLGSGFTSITQLPAAIRRDLDEATATSLARQAERNLDPVPIAPQGMTALQLQLMATYQPADFGRQDLRLVRDLVAPTEYDAFVRQQQAIGRYPPGGEAVSRQRLGGTLDGRISPAPTLAAGGVGAPAFLPAAMMQDGGSFAQDRAVALDLAEKRGGNPADILRSLKGLPARPAAEPFERARQASVEKQALAEEHGIRRAMSAPLSSDYYAINPGFSFFDYPSENSSIYKWHLTGNGIAAGVLDLAAVFPWAKATGFLRTGLSIADKGTINLVPRLGQKGV